MEKNKEVKEETTTEVIKEDVPVEQTETPVEDNKVEEQPVEPITSDATVQPEPITSQETITTIPKKSSCLPLVIVGVIVILVVVGVITGILLLGNKGKTTNEETTTTTTVTEEDNDKYIKQAINKGVLTGEKGKLEEKSIANPSEYRMEEFILNNEKHILYFYEYSVSSLGHEEKRIDVLLDNKYLLGQSDGSINQKAIIKGNDDKEYAVFVLKSTPENVQLIIFDDQGNYLFKNKSTNCALNEAVNEYEGKYIKVEDNTVYFQLIRGFDPGGNYGHSMEIKAKVVDGDIQLKAGRITEFYGSTNCIM